MTHGPWRKPCFLHFIWCVSGRENLGYKITLGRSTILCSHLFVSEVVHHCTRDFLFTSGSSLTDTYYLTSSFQTDYSPINSSREEVPSPPRSGQTKVKEGGTQNGWPWFVRTAPCLRKTRDDYLGKRGSRVRDPDLGLGREVKRKDYRSAETGRKLYLHCRFRRKGVGNTYPSETDRLVKRWNKDLRTRSEELLESTIRTRRVGRHRWFRDLVHSVVNSRMRYGVWPRSVERLR